MTFHLSHTTRTYPRLPYVEVKDMILGKKYELSLTFVGETRGRAINKSSRNKSYTPNVLSFPLTKEAGEIYITPAIAKREARRFGHSYKVHTLYLFIHGLLHLKGYDHGDVMEKLEEKYLRHFS